MRKILAIFVVAILLPGVLSWHFHRSHTEGLREVEGEWQSRSIEKVQDFGATSRIEVTPLVNWHTASDRFRTEPGVSYLIKTDDHLILFDLGFNQGGTSPSPLEHNMKALEVSLDEIDTVFISHAHRDHLGGVKWEKARSFSTGLEQRKLTGQRIFAPVSMTYPGSVVETVNAPKALSVGIASTGPIARKLVLGRVDEQALVVNLEGKGLVVIVGCGHQTIPKLLRRVEESFDAPIYAIVGDLHYPVPKGRLYLAGMDVQRRLASGTGIFNPISEEQVHSEIEALENELHTVILGGHDTSDEVFVEFKRRFGDRFHQAQIGETVLLKGQ